MAGDSGLYNKMRISQDKRWLERLMRLREQYKGKNQYE